MEKALKVISWIATVIGGLAILSGVVEGGEEGMYSVLGGALFLAQGWLSLAYMGKYK